MGDELKDLVECHSGYEYAERPVALHWQGQRLEIEAVEAEWRIPGGRCFRVRCADDRKFCVWAAYRTASRASCNRQKYLACVVTRLSYCFAYWGGATLATVSTSTIIKSCLNHF